MPQSLPGKSGLTVLARSLVVLNSTLLLLAFVYYRTEVARRSSLKSLTVLPGSKVGRAMEMPVKGWEQVYSATKSP